MVIKVSVSDNLVSSYRSWCDISQLYICRARMSSNVFKIFLSMNLLVAQKNIVNIPLDQECKGTEFLFCVTRGILFRLASPYSEPNRRKGFFVDQCTLDKSVPLRDFEQEKKGKNGTHFLVIPPPQKQKFAHFAWAWHRLCTEKIKLYVMEICQDLGKPPQR